MRRSSLILLALLILVVSGAPVGCRGDSDAPVLSDINCCEVTGTAATITWTTNEPTTGVVEYGPTAAYGYSGVDSRLATSHTVGLTDLIPGTTYHYRVVSTDGNGNAVTSADLTLTAGVDVIEAQAEGLIQAAAYGAGLQSVRIRVKSLSTDPLTVFVLPCTVLESPSGDAQDMVITEYASVSLDEYGREDTLAPAAACLDMHLDAPSSEDSLSLRSLPAAGDLAKLLQLPGFADDTVRVRQFAIWTITDNPNCREAYTPIRPLISMFGSGPSEQELDSIRNLFEAGEIDSSKYAALGGPPGEVTITEVAFRWDYGDWGKFDLRQANMAVHNNGDFPLYVKEGTVTIETQEVNVGIGEVVQPGEERMLSGTAYLYDIDPGQKALSVELLDSCGLVVGTYSSTVTPAIAEQTQFELRSWAMVDDWGLPSLQIDFTTTGDIYLVLSNPNGVQTGAHRVYEWATQETTLPLANSYVVPDAGAYTLTAMDALGTTIATQTFTFAGAQATVYGVMLEWYYWSYSGDYSLDDISFGVRNDGDLPIYVREGTVSVGTKQDDFVAYDCVMPGEEKLFTPYASISHIAPGETTLSLEIRDGAGAVLCSYSATVTPS